MLEAVALYTVLSVCAHVGIAKSSGGELYDLTPRGLGIVVDAFVPVVWITVLHQLTIRGSASVRPIIRWVHRALMYLVFIMVFAIFQWQLFVAVRLTPDQIILVRHYPQSPLIANRSELEQPEINPSRQSRSLTVQRRIGGSCQSLAVYPVDATTSATLDRLAQQLNARTIGPNR